MPTIPSLPAATTPLTGTELMVIEQSGETRKVPSLVFGAAYADSILPGQGGTGASAAERAVFARIKRFELRGGPAGKVPMISVFAWKDVGNRFTLTGGFANDLDGTGYAAAFTITVGEAAGWDEPRHVIDLEATGSTYPGVTGMMEMDFEDTTAFGMYPPGDAATWNSRVLAGRVCTNSTARTNELNTIVDDRTTLFTTGNIVWATGHNAVLDRIMWGRGIDADPTKFYRISNFFYRDTASPGLETRINIEVERANDASGTGATIVAQYTINVTNPADYVGIKKMTLPEVSSSGETWEFVIDFGDGLTAIAAYSGGLAWATNRVPRNTITVSASLGETLAYRSQLPFTSTQTDARLRSLVRDIKVYGAKDTTDVKKYAISHVSIAEFPVDGYWRLLVGVIELDTGTEIAQGIWNNYDATDLADFVSILTAQLPVLTCTDYVIGIKSRMQVRIEFDWSAVTAAFTYTGTTDAFGGIHPDNVFTDEEVADYNDSDHWHEVIRVSAGAGTLRAAMEALYSPITGATEIYAAPLCERASYHHRILLDLIDDGDYFATDLAVPNYVDIRGNGIGRTWIKRENTNPKPLVQFHNIGKIFDLSFYQATTDQYCIHDDLVQRLLHNADETNSVTDDDDQNFRTRQKFVRMQLILGAGSNTWGFGAGWSAGQHALFIDCEGYHEDATNTAPTFGFHNTGPTLSYPGLLSSYNPAFVEMRGCSSRNATGISLITLEQSPVFTLSLHACHFNFIGHSISAGEVSGSGAARICWEIVGDYRGPWSHTDGDADSFTLEWVPQAAPKRRVRNSTGSTIPKGRFVRRNGTSTVALCAAGEKPDGWTHKAIANGADGDIVLTREITTIYIENAASATGEWGITTAGTLDYAASVKLGRTIGGVVTVW